MESTFPFLYQIYFLLVISTPEVKVYWFKRVFQSFEVLNHHEVFPKLTHIGSINKLIKLSNNSISKSIIKEIVFCLLSYLFPQISTKTNKPENNNGFLKQIKMTLYCFNIDPKRHG